MTAGVTRRALVFALTIGSAALWSRATVVAQTPVRDARGVPVTAPPAPAGTSTISGTVVSAGSDARPLHLASVVIIGATTGTLRVTSSDSSGRFTFTELPADRYLIGASKPPFIGGVAGARRPARPGTPVALAAGEKIDNVTIRLAPGAAISGLVTDERGEPAAGVRIAAQHRRFQGGERSIVSVPGATTATDDRGRYRLHSLPPGDYLVVAGRDNAIAGARSLTDADVDAALKGGRIAPMTPVDPNVAYAPVYFPGTARESDAGVVTLNAGDEHQNVNLRLELLRGAVVEGSVSTPDGQQIGNVTIVLGTSSASVIQSRRMARPNPDGTFRFTNVPPGSYALTASEAGAQNRFGSAAIEVAGTDQSGLQVTLGPPLSLAARMAFDGTAPPPSLAGRRVPLRDLTRSSAAGATPQVGPTNADGVFTMTALLPGQYVLGGPLFFGASTDSVTWALQSVVADGRDVTDLPIAIAPDSLPKNIVVTYGDRWQELTGRLRQSSGAAASDYTIVLFPADKAYWLAGSRRILTARPGTDGQFRFGGAGPNALPPGAYLLAAVTDIDRDEQFDPAFLNALVPAGVPLTLQPGERKVQDVVIK